MAVHVITTEAAAANPYHKQLSALNSGLGDRDGEVKFCMCLIPKNVF